MQIRFFTELKETKRAPNFPAKVPRGKIEFRLKTSKPRTWFSRIMIYRHIRLFFSSNFGCGGIFEFLVIFGRRKNLAYPNLIHSARSLQRTGRK